MGLECRIVVTQKVDGAELGMYDPVSGRYEPLGTHPREALDSAIEGLKISIERAGHKLTFCERSIR